MKEVVTLIFDGEGRSKLTSQTKACSELRVVGPPLDLIYFFNLGNIKIGNNFKIPRDRKEKVGGERMKIRRIN